MAFCASRAATRPCRLPRMALASVRVFSYCPSSRVSCSLTCGSRVPGRRRSALPSITPCAISRKEFRSLPSRNTASALTPSVVRNSLALLPMRCVSITNWPTADSSAAEAPPCSFSELTVSAVSSRSALWRLMARSAWLTCVSVFCCPSTTPAFFSALSTSGTSWSSDSCSEPGAPAMSPSPVFRPRTLRARMLTLSCTSGKAAALPTKACDTDLASRCDCVVAWPAAATCPALRLLATRASTAVRSSTARPPANRPHIAFCWRASGQVPTTGRPLVKPPASAPG